MEEVEGEEEEEREEGKGGPGPKMCTAGQRVLLTITGPGPSFFYIKI